MNRVIVVCMVAEVIANVQCDSTSNDHSIVQGIAAKIGFPPTVLKVFIKGDIQEEEIEKLLNLCTREDKMPNGLDLTRNRRNSVSDYIGKLYSFNNLFRPYRSIFRGFKHEQTTRTPWLKKFLRGVQNEPETESFWGMALGAHTFSPFSRPLAQTRMPYHRIRNQQRLDRLLGITRNYGNYLSLHHETKPYNWIKNQEKFDQLLGQVKSEEKTTAIVDQSQNATTRKAFHKAPLDVAGLKTVTFFHHLHAITTPKRLRFCEKQCADEAEEPQTRGPGSTRQPRPSSTGEQKTTSGDQESTSAEKIRITDEFSTTEKCTCTVDACSDDYLSDEADAERNYRGKGLNYVVSSSAVTKHVAQTKRTTYKLTTSRFTRSKERRPTGPPVWTLPPNAVLDQPKTTEEQSRALPATKVTPEDKTDLSSTMEYTTVASPHQGSGSFGETPSPERTIAAPEVSSESRGTCKHRRPTKQTCIPMPIPTRIRMPACPHTKTSTRRCTRKTTLSTADDYGSRPQEICDCRSKSPPSEEFPISVGDTLDEKHKNPSECNKGKPQKIIVRISSALGEVPVVIMRDNGVSGVSLSLVNDYLLDENNRLIKCLGRKPLSGRMDLNPLNNSSNRAVPHPKGYKTRHFLPQLIRHKLHGLQPKRYSFRINYNPSHRLVSEHRASLGTGNAINIPNPALNQDASSGSGISNPFLPYKSNPQMTGLGSFGLQYPAVQNPRAYQSFKMEPAEPPSPRLGPVGLPIPQMNLDGFPGNYISPKEYARFKIHPGIAPGRIGLSQFQPSALNLQPAFPQQVADTSQLTGYRPPFLPLFYSNKNDVQPPKYLIGGLQ